MVGRTVQECLRRWYAVIELMHAAPQQVVVATTGAGSLLATLLQLVPGASRTLLESDVPYSEAALEGFLGRSVEQFCDRRTALSMAATAWHRAARLAADRPDDCFGLACTGAIVSDRLKRGAHRFHWAVHSLTGTHIVSVELEKGGRDREGEEVVCTEAGLRLLAREWGITQGLPPDCLSTRDQATADGVEADPLLVEMMSRRIPLVCQMPGQGFSAGSPSEPFALISGAFNPLHDGHRGLSLEARRLLNLPVYYEMPVVNADKPPLDYLSLRDRCRQFHDAPLLLTSAATFAEKSRLFPGTVFVVGWDTFRRILEPRFYAVRGQTVEQGLAEIQANRCSFLVAGRMGPDGFHELDERDLPAEHRGLFRRLTGFRQDISSTELRLGQTN